LYSDVESVTFYGLENNLEGSVKEMKITLPVKENSTWEYTDR
jgi:hypothetical protein